MCPEFGSTKSEIDEVDLDNSSSFCRLLIGNESHIQTPNGIWKIKTIVYEQVICETYRVGFEGGFAKVMQPFPINDFTPILQFNGMDIMAFVPYQYE